MSHSKRKHGPPKARPPRRVIHDRRYTLHEAARYMRVSLRTLQRRIAAGEVRALIDGRLRFILGAELIRANGGGQ